MLNKEIGKILSFKDGSLKVSQHHNLYVAVGDEPFYRDQIFNKLVNAHRVVCKENVEVIKIDCEELTQPEVFNKILARDLFTNKRIILLKNFTKIKKLEFFYEKTFKDSIVFETEKAGRSNDYKELLKKTITIDCNKPKPWLEESDAIGKILGYLKRNGYEDVSQDTALYLYEQVGYNLYKIMSELDKVVMYKGGLQFVGPTITIDDIDKICVKGMHYNIFDLIDKILAGKKKDALTLLDNIFKYESSPGILLINLWYTHFENILYLKSTNKNDSELATYIRMPPMVIQKKLFPQSKKIPTGKIIESMNYLSEVDYNLRKGSFDLRYYLEKFILDY
jgi:DNA polymerase III delta subunit